MRFAKYVLLIALFVFAMSVSVFAQTQEDTATAVTVTFEIQDAWAIEATADDTSQTITFPAITAGSTTAFGSNGSEYFIVTYTASSTANAIQVSSSDDDWGQGAGTEFNDKVSMGWNTDTMAATGTSVANSADGPVALADDVAAGTDIAVNVGIYIEPDGAETVATYTTTYTFEIWSD